MRYYQTSRVLRRFLFVWVSLVFLWGLLHLFVSDVAAYKCWYSSGVPDRCPPLTLLLSSIRIGQVVAFTLLVLLYAMLLWTGLAGKIPQRWNWLSFLLQAGCVFVISLVVKQDNVVLSLYLVLILEAIGTLQKTRFTLLIGSSSLILFVLSQRPPVSDRRLVLHPDSTATRAVPLQARCFGFAVRCIRGR